MSENKYNVENLVEWLDNFYIYIGQSKLHGVGIFAAQDIEVDTKLFYYDNTDAMPISIADMKKLEIPNSVIEILKRLYHERDGYIFLKEKQDLTWVNIMNHSKTGNLKYENGYYIANRNIKTHEELTMNYLNWRDKLNFKENE
jgi:hypothetical protein